MDISFERGDPQRPKGHALIYFRVDTEPDKIYASYIVTLPISTDFTKYIPPFLAAHVGNLPLSDFSAFAMPPVPEVVDSYQEVDRLSQMRGDDLLYGASTFSFDLPRMMEMVSEAVQAYSQLCSEYFSQANPQPMGGPAEPVEEAGGTSYRVNEVLFSMMSEGDKLAELSNLLGKLRFGQEGQDTNMVEEVREEIDALTKYLPTEFKIPSLLLAALDASQRGSRLAQLYLDRCFRLSAGDSRSAAALEAEIQSLQGQE